MHTGITFGVGTTSRGGAPKDDGTPFPNESPIGLIDNTHFSFRQKNPPHKAGWMYKTDLVTMKHVPAGFAHPPNKHVEPEAANRAAHARR